jgi:hypothetical protein
MKTEWRDPTDDKPSALKTARSVTGFRSFCSLRRMMQGPGSQIETKHVRAADKLRTNCDVACLGYTGLKQLIGLPVDSLQYRPSTGPSKNAIKQARACKVVQRAFALFTRRQCELLMFVVLENNPVSQWAQRVGSQPGLEMGTLIAVLDILAKHFDAEIEDDRQHGREMAT